MNVEKRSDPVSSAVWVIQPNVVQVLASNDIDTGVVDRVGKNKCGHINCPHQHSSVNLLLALRRLAKMEGAGNICRPICNKTKN